MINSGAVPNAQMCNLTNTSKNAENELTDFQLLARIAGRFLLVSSLIVNTRREPDFLIGASTIGLFAGILLVKSAILESQEQQISPGETTFANKLKLIGTSGNLICSFLLFIALITEIKLGQPPTVAGQSSISGGVGSLFI